MSGISLSFDIKGAAGERIAALIAGLTTRAGLNQAIGGEMHERTREYLRTVTGARHETANRLGATPSGFWAQAAEQTTVRHGHESATVSVHSPGIGRVARDVTITPGAGKQWLTLPLIAQAYNQRAYRVPGLVAIVNGPKGTGVLMMPGPGTGKTFKSRQYRGPKRFKRTKVEGGPVGTAWYALVKRVRQRKDRTLLPSDAAYLQAAKIGLRNYIQRELLARSGGGRN